MSEVTTEEQVAEQIVPETPTSLADLKPKMKLSGKVTRLELYGAFIDIGVKTNALIHISQLSKDRVNRVSDVLNQGDEVSVWVDKVDPVRKQVMVTMIEPLAVEWSDLEVGQNYTGRITRLENFGAFVDIGAEREGLVHISEISHDYIKNPSERLRIEQEVQVQVLGFSKRKRRIDLSIKALEDRPEPEPEPEPEPRPATRPARSNRDRFAKVSAEGNANKPKRSQNKRSAKQSRRGKSTETVIIGL